MRHRFVQKKRIPSSRSNVVANYCDFEHIYFHPGIDDVLVLSETDRAACLQVTLRIGFFRFVNIQYIEFRPPNRFFQIAKTFFGLIQGRATIEEFAAGTPDVHCEVTTEFELHIAWPFWPIRKLLAWQILAVNRRLLHEDTFIFERRRRLFGDYIGDYVSDENMILFKRAVGDCYGPKRPATS